MTGWSTDAARAFLLISVAAVDGSFADEELESIRPSLLRDGLTEDAATEAMRDALVRYRETIGAGGLEAALLSSAQHLKETLAPSALAAFMQRLVDTALADARMAASEHAYLAMLQRIWEL